MFLTKLPPDPISSFDVMCHYTCGYPAFPQIMADISRQQRLTDVFHPLVKMDRVQEEKSGKSWKHNRCRAKTCPALLWMKKKREMASFTLFSVLISIVKAQLLNGNSSLQGIPLPPQSWVLLSPHRGTANKDTNDQRSAVASAVPCIFHLNCLPHVPHSNFPATAPLPPLCTNTRGPCGFWLSSHTLCLSKMVLIEETLTS